MITARFAPESFLQAMDEGGILNKESASWTRVGAELADSSGAILFFFSSESDLKLTPAVKALLNRTALSRRQTFFFFFLDQTPFGSLGI